MKLIEVRCLRCSCKFWTDKDITPTCPLCNGDKVMYTNSDKLQ